MHHGARQQLWSGSSRGGFEPVDPLGLGLEVAARDGEGEDERAQLKEDQPAREAQHGGPPARSRQRSDGCATRALARYVPQIGELDAQALAHSFNRCLATPENLQRKLDALRFAVGDEVECKTGGHWSKGKVVAIDHGVTTSHVKIDIGGGSIITSAITKTSVEELKLEVGKQVYAIVKASDVMVGID